MKDKESLRHIACLGVISTYLRNMDIQICRNSNPTCTSKYKYVESQICLNMYVEIHIYDIQIRRNPDIQIRRNTHMSQHVRRSTSPRYVASSLVFPGRGERVHSIFAYITKHLSLSLYIYIYICIHIYIIIYVYVCIYIYIYVYTHMCICMYIYIYICIYQPMYILGYGRCPTENDCIVWRTWSCC